MKVAYHTHDSRNGYSPDKKLPHIIAHHNIHIRIYNGRGNPYGGYGDKHNYNLIRRIALDDIRIVFLRLFLLQKVFEFNAVNIAYTAKCLDIGKRLGVLPARHRLVGIIKLGSQFLLGIFAVLPQINEILRYYLLNIFHKKVSLA